MEPTAPAAVLHHPEAGYYSKLESAVSGVSWAAVAGGAFVAAAISLILLAFGAGLGLASVSPWADQGASITTVSIATIIWLVVMQLISASMGGYVAGRLRTKWVDLHTDEVYFRDTAHGFLVWAVSLVIAAGFLGSAASSLVGAAAEVTGAATATVATAAAGAGAAAAANSGGERAGAGNSGGSAADPSAYFTDTLFRSPRPNSGTAATASPTPGADTATAGGNAAAPAASQAGASSSASAGDSMSGNASRGADMGSRAEAGRILAHGLATADFPPADRAYLAQMVAARTGMSSAEAETRVNQVIASAQDVKNKALEKADQARHTAAELAFWTFFAMLAGAFAASFSATLGGRQRDAVRGRI